MNTIPQHILEQAADRLTQLHSAHASAAELAEIALWRAAHPLHEQAWLRAERFLKHFDILSPELTKATLATAQTYSRRQALGRLSALIAAPALGWLTYRAEPWHGWFADYQTAVGEQRTITLTDGSQLVLNTHTQVNIHYSPTERVIQLHRGEIMLTTAADPAPTKRPLFVRTTTGQVQALGTQFSVQHCPEREQTAVMVFAHQVNITAKNGQSQRVETTEQAKFDQTHIFDLKACAQEQSRWTTGMMIARQQPLREVLHELSRYRQGFIRCDRDLENLRISGAFSLQHTEQSLEVIAQTYQLKIHYFSKYLILLEKI